MKKFVIFLIVVVVGLGLGFFFVNSGSGSTTSAPHESLNPNASTTFYTLVDVAKNKDASSCWSAINGKVYDLTNWISEHPGGEEAILSICGKDGSEAFNNQHGTAKKQADILAGFLIGNLK